MSGWEPATLYYNIVERYKSVTEAWILSAPSLNISHIITALPLSEVQIAIIKYGNHPSIIANTEKMEKLGNHKFRLISLCLRKQ